MASTNEVDKTNKEANLLAMMMESPRISITEILQKEKQIMVDPLSLKESSITKTTMLPTIITTTTSESPTTLLHPPILKPPKLRFLSLSLPNSALSSPKFSLTLSNKKSSKGEGNPEPENQTSDNLTNKLHNLLQEVHLRKSKSYGEGRESAYGAPPLEEFDDWLTKRSAKEHDKWEWNHSSFTKNEAVKESPKSVKHMKTSSDDGFKCSALCLYLPSFVAKIKQVKTRKENGAAAMCRTVSLENFECGSWASATMFHDTDGESNNSYFDLPMELIHYSATEVYSPIAASFVYEKEAKVKGVLKNSSSRTGARKSDSSPRHVRFSISSSASNPASPASCISPRLRKAREDFNAFLAAQTAS